MNNTHKRGKGTQNEDTPKLMTHSQSRPEEGIAQGQLLYFKFYNRNDLLTQFHICMDGLFVLLFFTKILFPEPFVECVHQFLDLLSGM
mgnify:CR=1 FL=1